MVLRRHEMLFDITGHIQPHRKREMRVDFLLEHRQHVERIPHRVEAEDSRQLFEAGPT